MMSFGSGLGASTYKVWCVGNCESPVETATAPGAILIGGGEDPDEAFAWQIRNANGGDYLVLSAADYGDEYNDYVFDMSTKLEMQLNSVTTIQFLNKGASYDSFVLDTIRGAEAVFFEGGDQSRYMDWWIGTEVQSILQSKVDSVTIGGTSAGLAVLGRWVFTAEYDSIESDEAMQNPYDKRVDIAGPLLRIPYLDTIITDTHFYERDRMGRMLTFLSRIREDSTDASVPVARAIGVDEPAGVILNVTSGLAKAVGSGNVYICTAETDPELCDRGSPLTFLQVPCHRLSADNEHVYDFATWTGQGVDYLDDIENGVFLNLNPYGL